MGAVTKYLQALVITLLGAFGASVVHLNAFVRPDSGGFGFGMVAVIAAFMLYRIWFWDPA